MSNYGRNDWAPDYIRCLLVYTDGKLSIKCSKCGVSRQTSGKKRLEADFLAGKRIDLCRDCRKADFVDVKVFTDEMAKTLGIKIDGEHFRAGAHLWIGKWCESCESFVPIRVSSLRKAYDQKRFVSNKCWNCSQTGETVTSSGYRLITAKDHPMANKDGYVLEHRLVMESSIGRYLYPFETVHHKDGDKLNNDISNLQLRSGNHGQGISMSCGDCGSHNITYLDL